jgi:hypothetical protein
MEFRIWVETRLDGRILERELVSSVARPASGIGLEEIGLNLEEGKAVLRKVQARWNLSSFLPPLFSLQMSRRKESGHLAPPSPSAFGDLTGTSVPLRYLGQQGAVSSGCSGGRRTTAHL